MKLLLIFATSLSSLFVTGSDHLEGTKNSNMTQFSPIIEIPCNEGEDEEPVPMLSGRIADNTMFNNPLYHACVELKTTGGTLVSIIGTNFNGHYYFNSVSNGSYNLVVSASGFTTQTIPITVSGSPQIVNATMY